MQIDSSSPVMVTGATGYVAGWIVKKLLEAGVTVHAPVRDPDNPEKLQYLNGIAEHAPGSIRYFKADLLQEGSYADAMAGCSVVFHTASPFRTGVTDPQKELIDPALLGTRNVLEEANRTPSVQRVVLTSSCVAIYGDNIDLKDTPDGMFTEEIWNTTSSLEHQPYAFSKTVAEREAWKIAGAQDRWRLVVVNPSLVLGPGINPHATSASFDLIRQFGNGAMKAGVPDFRIGAVDVRDVAEAHLAAAWLPDAEGRHIVSGHNTTFPELARTLIDKYGADYPIPRRTMSKWLVWLVAPMVNKDMTRKMVSRSIGHPWIADNAKSKEALGITYRPLQESMTEFFQQLIDSGTFGEK